MLHSIKSPALLEMMHMVKIFQCFLKEAKEESIINNRCQHGISCLSWNLWARPSFRKKQNVLDPTKRAKQGLCYQIWVSKMWWPAPSSLSLLLNPKGLLGLEANVLKVGLCSCHATRAHIMGTKICWIGLVCSFLSLATDETPWSYSKLMLASRWAYCIEFLS